MGKRYHGSNSLWSEDLDDLEKWGQEAVEQSAKFKLQGLHRWRNSSEDDRHARRSGRVKAKQRRDACAKERFWTRADSEDSGPSHSNPVKIKKTVYTEAGKDLSESPYSSRKKQIR